MNVILFIFGMIIIWLVTESLMTHLSYKPLFDWWNGNGGSAYSDKFSLSTCMISYYSTPLYYLSKLTISPQEFLTLDQIAFLVGDIFPYLRATVNNVQTGILLPRHMCESVLLKTSDQDVLFNSWHQNLEQTKDENTYLVYGEPTTQTSPVDANGNSFTYLTFGKPIPDSNTGLIGVYPAPSDMNSWMGLISEWGGPYLKWQLDSSKKFYSPEALNTVQDGSNLEWFNWNSTNQPRPDNFLARMGIPPDSPLVVYFCTGKYSVNSLEVDASAFTNLLTSAGANAGGWIAYTRGMGDSKIDILRNYIYTKVDWLAAPNKTCNPSSSTLNTTSAVVSSVVPALLMAIPMMFVAPEAEAGEAAAAVFSPGRAAGLLGLIGTLGILSGVKAANASKC